jgi:hypothetical protein
MILETGHKEHAPWQAGHKTYHIFRICRTSYLTSNLLPGHRVRVCVKYKYQPVDRAEFYLAGLHMYVRRSIRLL